MIKLYEKWTKIEALDDIKNTIMLRAVESNNVDVIDFFVKKKYNYDNDNIIETTMYNNNSLRYFLGKGINFIKYYNNDTIKRNIKDTDVQKILIDFNYEDFIYDTVGFNFELKQDPKYSKIIQRFEEQKKYNL